MQNIVTLGQINDALKITSVTAAQLAEMGFAALENKPICEALPPEESRRLRNAKLYQADSIVQIRVALAKRLAAPASCLRQIQEPPTKTEALAHYSQQAILAMGEASAAAVAVPDVVVKEVMWLVELHRQEIIKAMDEEGSLMDVQTAQDAIEAKRSSLLAGVSAPAAMAVEPFGYVNTNTGQFFKNVEPCRKTNEGHWRTVFTEPQAQADARDADDAALVEWLSGQYLAADFHWGDPKTPVLVIEIPPTASVCGDFRTDVRGAIAAQAAQQGGDKQ